MVMINCVPLPLGSPLALLVFGLFLAVVFLVLPVGWFLTKGRGWREVSWVVGYKVFCLVLLMVWFGWFFGWYVPFVPVPE